MLPNGMPYKGKWADRRGRLSLLWSLTPFPLSEWRGEWIFPFTCTPIPDRYRGNSILKWKKRLLSIEEGVSLPWKGRLFISKKRPLCLLIVVFTPLSIRRGAGGEAPFLPLGEAGRGAQMKGVCPYYGTNCNIWCVCFPVKCFVFRFLFYTFDGRKRLTR